LLGIVKLTVVDEILLFFDIGGCGTDSGEDADVESAVNVEILMASVVVGIEVKMLARPEKTDMRWNFVE